MAAEASITGLDRFDAATGRWLVAVPVQGPWGHKARPVTPDAARKVLAHAGETRYRGMLSGFTAALMKTIERADMVNVGRLFQAFPDEVHAWNVFKFVDGGVEVLRRAAEVWDG